MGQLTKMSLWAGADQGFHLYLGAPGPKLQSVVGFKPSLEGLALANALLMPLYFRLPHGTGRKRGLLQKRLQSTIPANPNLHCPFYCLSQGRLGSQEEKMVLLIHGAGSPR